MDNTNKSKPIGEIHELKLFYRVDVLKYERNNNEIIIIQDISEYKEKFTEEKTKETYWIFLYLYHTLQSMDNVPEIKYMLAYLSKATGFTSPNVFKFNEDKQFIFEGIIHSAFTLYSNGGASKARVIQSRNRFVEEIESRNEEKLSRTQQLTTIKIQALRELGYAEITTENAAEVLEKIAEIQSRKV